MQRLENAVGTEESFHIVPITGLILSVFLRLENECKTVLELWEPQPIVEVEKKVPGRTSLHDAITSDDFESFQILVGTEGSTSFLSLINQCHILTVCYFLGTDVNSQDNNGWTPLHCACSSEGFIKTLQHNIRLKYSNLL